MKTMKSQMSNPFYELKEHAREAVSQLYGQKPELADILIQVTRKEFEGDLTLVVFPFTRYSRKGPEETARELGEKIKTLFPAVERFNVVKGFLNLRLSDAYWAGRLMSRQEERPSGNSRNRIRTVLEYCGPNTNKPLHLGHVRNMVIGYSMANILEAAGEEVHKVNIYNDRGIAICKSMVAWLHRGRGMTPQEAGEKGDHFVGRFYVEFARMHREETEALIAKGLDAEKAAEEAPVMKEAREMLRKWEAGDPETLELWKTMNAWVYEGFEETYRKLGVDFEKNYYESQTYLKGKEMVMEGLEKGICYQKEDGSVWIDLSDEGLDEKLLIRRDGTSVYLTQDLGTAEARWEDYRMDRSVYTVANEQDYHFKALRLTLKKLGMPYWEGIYHLSYGMVDLPTGKMKSREGTTVDADDLYERMISIARENSEKLGKLEGMDEKEKEKLYRMLGLGALKYFLLRVNAKKRILFDPQASIDFQGDTGPFIQYTHARIRSVLRKWKERGGVWSEYRGPVGEIERELLIHIDRYGDIISEAAASFDPSQIANYVFALAKSYNRFYHEAPILQADDEGLKSFRIRLSEKTAGVIRSAMKLLGIEVPERM